MPASADQLCTVTHTFYDAEGAEIGGVVVRFTPEAVPERVAGLGLIAKEVTAVSSSEEGSVGQLTMTLLRGMKGRIAISHVTLARDVEVPDKATCDLLELVAETPDPLEPVNIDFIDLPRRS